LHAPSPSHEYPVCVPLAQVVLPQLVPLGYSLHALDMPLHTPLLPQVFAPWSVHSFCGSRLPTTNPHSPSAPAPRRVAVQASQSPVQAVSQHTLSAQLPLVHCEAAVQPEPFARSGLHVPEAMSQYEVATQAVSLVHVVKHADVFAQV
jgi:hypothetical protein